ELGLGRVQIFRLGRSTERAGAERNDLPSHVHDRDGEPIAEAIVRAAAVVRLDEETRVEELDLAESAFDQSRLQRVLRVRCEAHAKGLDGLRREPASLGIGQRLTAFARAELLFEIEGRRLERVIQAEALACGALELRVWLRQ